MAEQIKTTQAHATIVQIDGKVYLRDASGKTVPLQKGQELNEAQILVTDADGYVQLQIPNGQLIDIGPTRTVQIDAQMLGSATFDAATAAINDLAASTAKIAAAINNGQDLSTELEATAAGLGGAGQGEGHSFVQLLRVAEGVNPLAFNFVTNFKTTPNDAPPAQAIIVAEQGIQAVNDAVTLEEDGQSRINVLGNDSGNNITVSSASASNGTVVINTDGTITYKPNANYNGPDQIIYTITDANGAVSSATVAVTVTPVNDLPTQVDNNGNPTSTPVQISTKEDTPIAGKVNAKDPDGDTLTFTPKDQPTHGSVTVNPDGSYEYTPALDYNGKDSFTVTVGDGKGGTAIIVVDVTVDPVNDAPVGNNQSIITPEDTPITGKLIASDKDGDPLTFVAKDQPTHGTVTVKPDGSYEYTPAPDYNGKDSFTVTVGDGKGGTAIITVDVGITPVEDPTNISGTDLGIVQEDGILIAEGKLNVSDKDAGQSEVQPAAIKNEFGTFAIDKDGKWSFTLDNNAKEVQALTSQDSFDKTFTVQSLDGTTHDVVVTIKGQDDAAEITPNKPGDDAGQVKEDTVLTTSGTLLVNDKDAGQSSFQAQTDTDGTYGKFSIDANGKWIYTLNNSAPNVQELKEGETKTETFAVKSADGTTSNVVVTIIGTNDTAIIAPNKPGDDAGQVKEDVTLTTSGTLLVNDKDAGQSSFQAQTDLAGTYGKFSIGTDGKWTYALNNSATNVQELKEGETKTETFVVKSADGTTSSVVVTIVGTNDAAVITPSKLGDDAGSVKEDTTLTTSGNLLVNDKDTGQSSFQAQTDLAGTYGKFSIDANGKWAYALNNAAANVQALNEGETKTETFTVKSADGTTSNVVVTIVGTNDAAIITPSKPSDDAGSVKEDTTLTTSGTLLVNDKDAGQSSFQAQTDTDGTYGKFSIDANGKWTYALNNSATNVQELKEGETKTETFVVKSADGTTSNVVVTIVGTNDAAIITPSKPSDDAGSVKEDTTLTTRGTLLVNDKDAGQSSFQAQTDVAGTYGKFSIGMDGKWTYELNNNDPIVQALKDGDVQTETFTVKSTDGTTSTITVAVNGTNETVTIGHGAVQEDTIQSSSGTLTATGGATFVTQTDAAGTYGKLTLGSDGKWTYTLNNDADNVQALKTGETKTESFDVVLSDGTKTTITIDVQGLDDKAIITPSKLGDDTGAVKEDTTLTTSGTLLVNDKDTGQSNFQAQTDVAGTYGKFSINANGKWTYALNNAAANVQALNEGETKTETFAVKSADGTTSSVVVTIVGTNDAAIITPNKPGDDAGQVKEDVTLTTSGTLLVNDKDTGQSSFQAQTDTEGTYGKFSIDANGKWIYALNNNDPIVQALKDGDVKTETFTVQSADGTTSTITVAVNGTNETATIGHGAVQEDTVQSSSGTLTATGGATFVTQTDAAGTYGKLTLGSDGKWTYTLNNDADNVQALKTGETKTESFDVVLSDGTKTTITIDVQGLDDKAIITPSKLGDDTGSVKEDTTLATSGTLLVNDKDAGQSSFQAQTDTDGTYGKFSIGTDGKWTYVLNNAAANVQALNEGEAKTETFAVKSADSTTSNVVVTIVGTNDAAIITPSKPSDDAGSVKEDTTLTTSGNLLVNDKDTGQSSFQAQTDVAGTYGKFSIDANGKWTYALNNAASNVQELKEGETKTETFTVKSADGTTSNVVVTIIGTNDAAIITPNKPGDDAGQVKEDVTLTTSGTLLVNDKDAGQSSFQAQTDVAGTYGKFSIGTDGKWTYALNNSATNVQELKEGETKTETFVVKSADGTTSSVVVTIVGTNDAAVITPSKLGDDAGQVKEDVTLTTSGTLLVNDKDAGQSSFQAQTDLAGTYGKFSINANGKWTYALNNAAANVQALNEGETKTETFAVTSVDGTTSNVVVTIVGTNDAAILTPSKPSDDAGSVKEDTTLTTSGTLLVNDKDAGQSNFQAQTDTDGTYGKFSIGTDGKWTYVLNNAASNVQELKEGETKTETFAVKSADGTTSNVVVTIVGTNDAAIITPSKPSDDAGSVKEDTTLTTSGTLLVNDKDAGQSSFQAQTDLAGTYGKFSVDANGKWAYALNNAAANVQALNEGETKTETFAVTSVDGTTSNVVVTIVGTNDAAIITPNKPSDDAGSVKEDTTLTTSGTLLVNDKDTGQSSFQAQTDVAGTYGKFSIGTDGKWTYALNNSATNVQELKEGETKTETFTVKSADGTTSNVVVTIIGTNDAAIITPNKPGDDAGQVKEDVTLTTSATLLVNDKDTGQSSFQAQTDVAGTYGKFSINADGKWTYALNNNDPIVQALKDGDVKTETFTVKSADGATSTITVTVNGTNETVTIGHGAVQEDTVQSSSGTLTATGGATFVTQTNTAGTYGKLTVGSDGKWTYILNNDADNVQALKTGESKIESFDVVLSDGTKTTITIDVQGLDDKAIITPSKPSDDAGSVKEDTTLTTSGTLLVNDKDTGQSSFQAQTDTDGTYGKFSIDANGKWTYALNNAAANVQALNEGETKTETFTVKSADGTTSNVVVTIVGTNDAAIITPNKPGDDAGQVKEDVTLTTSGTLLVNDKDAGQSSFQAQTDVAGTYGKFSINANGKWTYALNNAAANVQELKEGETKTETFAVKSADGTTSNVVVTIIGTNDAAIITPSKPSDDAGQVKEDVTLTTSGTLLVNDKDAGQSSFQAQTDVAGTYGKFSIGTGGKWSYVLNNAAANVQALAEGETKTETFVVKSADGTTSNVVVTIIGTNDAAIITPSKLGDDTGSVKEDTTLTTSGTLLVNDKDAGQSSFQAQTDLAGTYGKFSIDANGKWTYALNNAAANVQALNEGETKTETFVVKSADGTTSNVVVTIIGTNDTAIITPNKPGDDAGQVKEDVTLTTSGTLLVNDKDAGQSSFQAQTDLAGTYGKFSIGTDGKWTYALNNSATNVQELKEGETKTETFAVKSADGTTSNVVVTIIGTNDAAIITPNKPGDDAGQVKEDVTLTTSGTLLVNDKDTGQSSFQAQTDVAGSYGKFSIGTGGKWTYALNNAAANVQALAEGETKTETFAVKSADGTTSNVVVTIIGTNDAAIIAPSKLGDDAGQVKEDVTLTTSGTLLVNDKDTGQSSFQAQTDTEGTYGKFSIDANGKWTYALNNNDPIVQALKDGDVKTETFTVKSADGTTSTITVTVNGSNESASVGHGAVQEDTVQSSTGTLTATGGATFMPQTDAAGTYGKLTLSSDGKWTYILNNDADNVQALKTGESKTESFDVTLSDGTKTTITIDVQGLNDKAIIGQGQGDVGAGTVKEDTPAQTTTSGHLTVSDKDASEASFTPQSVKNAYGTFTLQANGNWKFDIDNTSATVQALKEGEQIKFDLPVTSLDGTTGKVSITVIGTNDAAIIGQGQGDVGAGIVKEDTPAQTTASGHLTVTDKDASEASFTPQSVKNAYGTFTLQTNGDWKFDIDNSSTTVQALKEGEQAKFDLPVTSLDGTAGKVSITVIGTNDAPSSTGGAVTGSEDTVYAFKWNDFNAVDSDTAASSLSIKLSSLPADGILQFNGLTITNPAQFTISKADIDAGKLTFVPDANESGNNSFNTAGTGDQKSDYAKFDYQVNDGSASSDKVSMVVDIKPVADMPVISIGGISIVDGTTTTVTPPKGNGLIQQYYAPNTNDNLNTTTARTPTLIETALEGKTPTSTTLVSSADVYINNGASAPSGIATDSAYRVSGLVFLEEGKNYTFSGYVDDTSLLKIGGVELMNRPYDGYGTFTATPFVPSKSGYYTVEFLVYNASNVGAMDLNVSVNGAKAIDFNTSNFPLFSNLAQLESTGGLHSNMVATGDGGYYPQGISGQEDSFIKLFGLAAKLSDTDGSETLQSLSLTELKAGSTVFDGVHTYNAPSDGSALNLKGWDLNNLQIRPPRNFFGEYKVGLQAVSIENSTGETATNNAFVSIQVANTNDTPTTSDDSASIREDSTPNPITGNVLSNDSDVDGDKLVVQAINNIAANVGKAISGQFGQLTIDLDGNYRYTLDNNNPRVNALNDSDSLSEKFTYTVSDGKGGTSTATLTINIQGHTDPVVIMGSRFNDQIGDLFGESNNLWTNEKTEGTVIDLQLGGGSVTGAPNPNPSQRFQYTQSIDQVIDAGGGNDYVESGRGDDVIYAGDSDSAGYKFADILGQKLMTLDLGSLIDSSTQLFSATAGVSNPKADVVNGGSGHDAIFGQSGVDLLYGHTGNDYLDGGNENDALRGGLGNDVLRGGSGNDVLRGDAGDDVFLWMPSDQAVARGATAAGTGNEFGVGANVNVVKAATDVVIDFNQNVTAGNNDKLDMRDLLIGETHGSNDIGNLLNYLHVEKTSGSTVIHVSTAGEFNAGYNAGKEDQTIILQGVDLTGATDADIVKNLLQNNKLIVD